MTSPVVVPGEPGPQPTHQGATQPPPPLSTCQECRVKKVKCDKGRPCSRCLARNIECRDRDPPPPPPHALPAPPGAVPIGVVEGGPLSPPEALLSGGNVSRRHQIHHYHPPTTMRGPSYSAGLGKKHPQQGGARYRHRGNGLPTPPMHHHKQQQQHHVMMEHHHYRSTQLLLHSDGQEDEDVKLQWSNEYGRPPVLAYHGLSILPPESIHQHIFASSQRTILKLLEQGVLDRHVLLRTLQRWALCGDIWGRDQSLGLVGYVRDLTNVTEHEFFGLPVHHPFQRPRGNKQHQPADKQEHLSSNGNSEGEEQERQGGPAAETEEEGNGGGEDEEEAASSEKLSPFLASLDDWSSALVVHVEDMATGRERVMTNERFSDVFGTAGDLISIMRFERVLFWLVIMRFIAPEDRASAVEVYLRFLLSDSKALAERSLVIKLLGHNGQCFVSKVRFRRETSIDKLYVAEVMSITPLCEPTLAGAPLSMGLGRAHLDEGGHFSMGGPGRGGGGPTHGLPPAASVRLSNFVAPSPGSSNSKGHHQNRQPASGQWRRQQQPPETASKPLGPVDGPSWGPLLPHGGVWTFCDAEAVLTPGAEPRLLIGAGDCRIDDSVSSSRTPLKTGAVGLQVACQEGLAAFCCHDVPSFMVVDCSRKSLQSCSSSLPTPPAVAVAEPDPRGLPSRAHHHPGTAVVTPQGECPSMPPGFRPVSSLSSSSSSSISYMRQDSNGKDSFVGPPLPPPPPTPRGSSSSSSSSYSSSSKSRGGIVTPSAGYPPSHQGGGDMMPPCSAPSLDWPPQTGGSSVIPDGITEGGPRPRALSEEPQQPPLLYGSAAPYRGRSKESPRQQLQQHQHQQRRPPLDLQRPGPPPPYSGDDDEGPYDEEIVGLRYGVAGRCSPALLYERLRTENGALYHVEGRHIRRGHPEEEWADQERDPATAPRSIHKTMTASNSRKKMKLSPPPSASPSSSPRLEDDSHHLLAREKAAQPSSRPHGSSNGPPSPTSSSPSSPLVLDAAGGEGGGGAACWSRNSSDGSMSTSCSSANSSGNNLDVLLCAVAQVTASRQQQQQQ